MIWKISNGNPYMYLGGGLIKIHVNWRLAKPSGYDVWINGEKIAEKITECNEAQRIAVEYVKKKFELLKTDMMNL